MNSRIAFSLLLVLFYACTKIELLNPTLPEVNQLTIESINTQLPIVNIKSDQGQFDTMYANFSEDIFVEAEIDLFDARRTPLLISEKALIEIKGAGSAEFELKSIGIIFDESLDNEQLKLIDPPMVLPQHNLDKLYTVRLRNSGNDFKQTMIKDMSYTQLAIDAGVDFELMYFGGPHQVFVNGNYLGLLNMRSESNRKGMAGLRQAKEEDITIFRADIKNGNLEFKEGDVVYGAQLATAIREEDGEVLGRMIDVPSFIDYIIFQDYIGNFDWPHNNARAYSINGSKLRFVLFDMDLVAYHTKRPVIPELEYVSEDIAKIYRGLRDVDRKSFDAKVSARQKELYLNFSPEKFNRLVDQMATIIENEIPYQIAKYGFPASLNHWKQELDLLKREFERRDFFIRRKYKLK